MPDTPGGKPPNPNIKALAEELLAIAAARKIAAPPSTLGVDDDRDGPCGDALDPVLNDLLMDAMSVGWDPAEVLSAVLGWAVHTMADATDVEVTREWLAEADELLTLRGD